MNKWVLCVGWRILTGESRSTRTGMCLRVTVSLAILHWIVSDWNRSSAVRIRWLTTLNMTQILGEFAKLRKDTISFDISVCPSVRPSAWNKPVSTGRIFMKFAIWICFEKSVEKFQASLNQTKNNGYFTWRMISIFNSILLSSSQNVIFFQAKAVEKIKTHVLYSISFFFRKLCRLLNNVIIIIIIIIIYLSWSLATCWPVPVSRIQKSLQRSALIPSASWRIVFHYPG